jgi:hypothetical protein
VIAAKIAEHAYWMKREGYRDSTIRAAVKALRAVGRRCNLLDANAFKDYMAKAEYGENRRDHILDDARRFYKWLGVEFTKPQIQTSSRSLDQENSITISSRLRGRF